MKHGLIPKSVLNSLSNGPWKHSEHETTKFKILLGKHKPMDDQLGITSAYNLNNLEGSLTTDDLSRMVAEGVLPPDFHKGVFVNQHWLHSMEQFFAECTVAWNNHVERTNALIGTPSGRIN
jgi:hypothetical protein